MMTRFLMMLLSLSMVTAPHGQTSPRGEAVALKALATGAPRLPLEPRDIDVVPPATGWAMGMVSWVAADRGGVTYLLQRGDRADPIIAVDRDGRVLRSWGKGLYVMPHAIRVDPQGNVWTTDAASSKVIKFTPDGRRLLEIAVGGQPTPCTNNFCGTTDVAFGPDGRVFIADGYANARVLEYTADGGKVREWGAAGDGPGQFRLPHSIVVDENGVIYVADRENGRVQRFDLAGRFLGEWPNFGKTFSLDLAPGAVWLATQPRDVPNLSPGWLMKVDRQSGKLVGWVEATGIHGLEVRENGDLLFGPGPKQRPQVYRASASKADMYSNAAPIASQPQGAPQSVEPEGSDGEQIVRAWVQRWNALGDDNPAAIDDLLALYAPDALHITGPSADQRGTATYRGHDGIRVLASRVAATRRRLTYRIETETANEQTAELIHSAAGPWKGPSLAVQMAAVYSERGSEKRWVVPAAAFFQLSGGKIRRARIYYADGEKAEVEPEQRRRPRNH